MPWFASVLADFRVLALYFLGGTADTRGMETNATPVLTAPVLDRIAVDRDGRRIAFYEDSRGLLAKAWTKATKYGWLRQLVADAILSGRPLSIIDLQARACVAPFDGAAYPFHVAVEVRS